ncbi:multidrug efflux pump RND permease subunit MdtC [Gammaproteobacteria bacterium]
MNFSAPFVHRPVATTLLTLGLALAGLVCFNLLPVAPLPQVDFPTIMVQATLPGASPATMAATVATPLERSLGRIAGITEMTSQSTEGSTRVTLQFDLDRDINGAARDVQAAINAARTLLPSSLPSNPTYRKINPADAPIMILALTSDTKPRGEMYDAASTILAQQLARVEGVGQVNIGGGSAPAVRVELNPHVLNHHGIGLEEVRAAIVAANPNRPKGAVEDASHYWQIAANDQLWTAADYLPLIIRYRQGAAVRLQDVAEVVDGEQDLRNTGLANGQPAVLLMLYRQPGANIIETVDRLRALLPQLTTLLPAAIRLDIVMDRTPTIRASLHEVELTLVLSVILVVLVAFLFLGDWRATLIPSVAVPLSLLGTFLIMYSCGYSLDNLSLMALAVATGFVVDDAIVVLENVSRYLEEGIPPIEAALRGTREVSFTVISMTLSLVAVFIPILFMGGIIGRLFREFGVTLAAAVLVSLVVSLTTTPMMCARLLRPADKKHGSRLFILLQRGYVRSLDFVLRYRLITLFVLFATIAFNFYLYTIVPKGFFPQQDTGRVVGTIQADQGISFQAMRGKLAGFMDIIRADPAVANIVGFTGSGQRNGGFMFISLKPLVERRVAADSIIARLRPKLGRVAGASLFLQSVQDIRMGGRPGAAQYQYSLLSADLEDLRSWEPRIRAALTALPELADVNTDQQERGIQTTLAINRDTLARFGLNMRQVDATLNDAFGQRQISTIYHPLNQYRVVMEWAPAYAQSPESLHATHIVSDQGAVVPLAAFTQFTTTAAPLAVNHQGQFAASTLSFNLPTSVALGDATRAIDAAMVKIGVPTSVQGGFQGATRAFQDSLSSQPWLILAALLAVYITLGVLYESYIHPLTIISTLPSAGVGALLALLATGTDFTIISLIGIILLIGVVKKNAIMMIDFALETERRDGISPVEAIRRACLLRLRPILMTTFAALLGALPLAFGLGEGGELRRPLGISIVGGLMVSQVLTLYTTPVVYLYLDSLRLWFLARREKARWITDHSLFTAPVPS